ncbi:hypothetical protein [Alteribacter lacisalsi]|nr:hypothetical protein [Alteribacter lacisalsi]
MRTETRFRENGDTFESVFKELVDVKVDAFVKEKTKQTRAGNGIHEL